MIKNKIEIILKSLKKNFNLLAEPVIGYTRVVFATKFILSSIAVILMLTLILLPFINPVQNIRIDITSIEIDEETSDPKMISPRFQGVDKDGKTYNITAKEAIKTKEETLILDTINASIELKNGKWLAINSKKGLLKHKENQLKLSESVYLFTNDGYELQSDTIFIDIDKNMAYSKDKITGKGPAGTITADSFTTYDKGQRTTFKGNVKLVLHPEKIEEMSKQDK